MNPSVRPEFKEFLARVKSRISFREAHVEVELELARHLEDLIQESMADGESEAMAVQSALERMGDAEEIGARLNQVHRPKLPFLLIAITAALIVLGLVNVMEIHRVGSQSVNILIGLAAGVLLYWIKPARIQKMSYGILASGLLFLGAAAAWGETFDGIPYVKFLGFNIDATAFTLTPFVLALGGLIARANGKRNQFLVATLSLAPVLTLALSGSLYASILLAVAVLTMMVTAPFAMSSILVSAFAYSFAIGLSLSAEKFRSADNFASARVSEAHTDFVMAHLHDRSALLGALGLFLAMAVVAQLGTLFFQMRSRHGRVLVMGHLSIVALGITWSVLANLGYVAMPMSGAPMPFVSYGGSFLVGQLSLMGMSIGLYWRRTLSLTE